MVHTTRGIVLRTTIYGETSLIALIYTEMFGLQSYMINGARGSKKGNKASLFQPASIIEMEVYYNELKKLQRVKDARWQYLYRDILFNVYKNAIALFIAELLQKTIREPEENGDLYYFIENTLINLDRSDSKTAANYPLFFLIHLPAYLGFSLQDNFSAEEPVLDLKNGRFVQVPPTHDYYADGETARYIYELLHLKNPTEAGEIILNNSLRRQIMDHMISFYQLHLQDFASLRSLPILQHVFS